MTNEPLNPGDVWYPPQVDRYVVAPAVVKRARCESWHDTPEAATGKVRCIEKVHDHPVDAEGNPAHLHRLSGVLEVRW